MVERVFLFCVSGCCMLSHQMGRRWLLKVFSLSFLLSLKHVPENSRLKRQRKKANESFNVSWASLRLYRGVHHHIPHCPPVLRRVLCPCSLTRPPALNGHLTATRWVSR